MDFGRKAEENVELEEILELDPVEADTGCRNELQKAFHVAA